MPNPTTNFKNSFGTDLGNILITKEYLMTVYPQIAANMITPELWTWGNNSYGQLGDNTVTTRSTPVTTSAGGANWKQVSGGSAYTAAIKTDGTLWTWGANSYGRLGDNTTTNRSTPVTTFAGGTNWKQVACGSAHIAAIKTDGTLWTWGANSYGRLGDNTTTTRSIPVTTFAGGTNWKQVAGGNFHTAAIKTDGTLWTWGRNYYGQLGDNTLDNRIIPVTTFAGGTNWKQVAGGNFYTAAIKTDGTLWTWGNNNYGQLGDNTLNNRIIPVTTFAGGTNWKQVACGSDHIAAIKTDGTLWTWGRNSYGQLGNNTATNRSIPVTTFAGGTNWKQVAGGGARTAAIKTDGTLWTWGRGALGDNTTTNRSIPVTTFAGGTNWKQVSCGNVHTAAIKTSDDLLGI
jgi:alpha-tubulin suppressor-like RCC1 family protein